MADFLEDLSAHETRMGIPEDVLIKRILPLALVGDAARWLRLQPIFRSKQDFQQRFKIEFLAPDYEYRIPEKLQRRTQHPEESLAEFVRALQEL